MSRLTQAEARLRRQAKIRRYNEDLLENSRDLIARSLTLLRQGSPSTYLGRKRQDHRPNSATSRLDEL